MDITMKDIAKHAGVSTATVSKIVNGRDQHISKSTRERVLALIEEYHYKPNTVAKGLKIRKTYTIGFILPDISNPFFPEIARGIEDIAKAKEFAVIFCNTDNDSRREDNCFSFLKSKMVDGLIFTQSLHPNQIQKYLEGNIPMVVVDRNIETNSSLIGRVYVDTKSAIFTATNYLIKKGCKKIGFISAITGATGSRYEGYKEAIEANGLHINKNLIFDGDYSVDTGYQGTYALLEKINGNKCEIDGIVCGNDLIAVGTMNALQENKISVPKEVKVIGLDDIYFSRFLSPPLTTIKQPAYEMGRVAADMLINHILDNKPLYSRELLYELTKRESA